MLVVEHLFIVADLRSLFNAAFVSRSETVFCLITKLHVPSDSCPLAIVMKPMKERTFTTYVILFDILQIIPVREFVCLSKVYHYTLSHKKHTLMYMYVHICIMEMVPVDFTCPHKLSR